MSKARRNAIIARARLDQEWAWLEGSFEDGVSLGVIFSILGRDAATILRELGDAPPDVTLLIARIARIAIMEATFRAEDADEALDPRG